MWKINIIIQFQNVKKVDDKYKQKVHIYIQVTNYLIRFCILCVLVMTVISC